MGFVNRLMGSNGKSAPGKTTSNNSADPLTDGALDTLGTVVRAMGEQSFALDDGIEPSVFRDLCAEVACHVENAAPVPSLNIPASDNGRRQWGHVRRFFLDRRQQEKEFVQNRLSDYRDVVDDLVAGLREIGQRDTETALCVRRSMRDIETAVATGALPEIKAALNESVRNVTEGFARQKREYERRIGELNQRMSCLRQDLATTREEMARDALTATYNRGAFDQAIVQGLNLNFILNQPVTVMLIDLDHFKTINDSYGHGAGDEVLRSVGECLARSFIRKTDFVARYGGDEFAVILADTTAANSATLLARFYEYAEDIVVPHASEDLRVSCSAGYTEIVPGDTVESVVKRADMALYDAKKSGRNRYKLAPPPPPEMLTDTLAATG